MRSNLKTILCEIVISMGKSLDKSILGCISSYTNRPFETNLGVSNWEFNYLRTSGNVATKSSSLSFVNC